MRRTAEITSAVVVLVAAIQMGCASGGNTAPAGPTTLKGAGATAPYLVYSKWVAAYNGQNQTIKLEYQPTGSGEGIRQLEANTVDFAASDMPLDDAELAKLKTRPL